MTEGTPDPSQARTNAFIKKEEDSDDEMPLAMRSTNNNAKRSATIKNESDEDDIPLVNIYIYVFALLFFTCR